MGEVATGVRQVTYVADLTKVSADGSMKSSGDR